MEGLSRQLPEHLSEAAEALRRISGLELLEHEPLAPRTRFGIGGEADLFASTRRPDIFAEAAALARGLDCPLYFLGEGSNVVVSDAGVRGLVLRFLGSQLRQPADGRIMAEAGASLQSLVDFSIELGLTGLHTLARIPGSVGGAVYGNAGAYGRQIDQADPAVTFFDGVEVRVLEAKQCELSYRESIFKRRKNWAILACTFSLEPGDKAELRREADHITRVRDEKFPPEMRCAGSVFKNLLVAELPHETIAAAPEGAIRGGKIASAFFLEKVGAKGMRRGGIEIASYHANLIYNVGGGTASELRSLIEELKKRILDEFGIALEEEVQYVGDF